MTLDDVARRAGVHAATVSRAITRPELVRPATLQRVRAAIDALGYVPNRAARELAGGRTSRIAVVVPDVTNPYFAELVQAAHRHASHDGESVVMADTDHRPALEVEAVRTFAGTVDGIVLAAPVALTSAVRAAAGTTPLVTVNRRTRDLPSVLLDQRAVVDLAVAHLRVLGHRRIAVARGPSTSWSAEERERAARSASVDLLGPVEPTYAGGRELYDLVRAAGCTGVATFNDVSAFGLLAAAADDGCPVPGELSVVGSDDIPFASMVQPALTTVSGHARELGTTAIEVLHQVLAGETATPVTVDPTIVLRASTAPAP